MYWSKYNLLIKSESVQGGFLFNILSGALYELTPGEYEDFLACERAGKPVVPLEKDLLEDLIANKILVRDQALEYYKFKLPVIARRYRESRMDLAIRPGYVSEVGKPVGMSFQNGELLIDFIRLHDPSDIGVFWYDRDSLLFFDLLKRLTEKIRSAFPGNYRAELNTDFRHLKEEYVREFPALGIHAVRIFAGDDPEFLKKPLEEQAGEIQKYISLITSLEDVRLSVGIRSGEQDRNKSRELLKSLKQGAPESVSFGILPVPAADSSCGFGWLESSELPERQRQECIARHINGYVIEPGGGVYKCFRDVGDPAKRIRQLTDKTVDNLERYIRSLSENDPFEDLQCRSCRFLPLCLGGCPKERSDGNRCPVDLAALTERIEAYYTESVSQ